MDRDIFSRDTWLILPWNPEISQLANSIFRMILRIALWFNVMADSKDEESTVAKMEVVIIKS